MATIHELNISRPMPGWQHCESCGKQLAPKPLKLCRDCWQRVNRTRDCLVWDLAAGMKRQDANR